MIHEEPPTVKQQYAGVCFMCILLLSFADAMLTLRGIREGIFEEWNPLMELLISTSHILFIFVKMTLVALGSILLFRLVSDERHSGTALFFLSISALLYAIVCIYQVAALGKVG